MDNKFELLDNGTDDLYVNFTAPEISRKENNGWNFVIKSDSGPVEESQINKLFSSLETAFGWEEVVLDGKTKEMFWKNNEIDLIINKKMAGVMANNFNIKKSFALKKSKESVAAAIFHELFEMWREEVGLVGEGASLLAEFLLCGEDRDYFEVLSEHYGESRDSSHQIGWNVVINDFGFGKDGDKTLFEKLSVWKKSMTEDQKLVFIKDRLLNWHQG